MTKEKREWIQLREEFKEAARALYEHWAGDTEGYGIQNYPFAHSFDEVVLDIMHWCEADWDTKLEEPDEVVREIEQAVADSICCECGAEKTHGVGAPHSSWCPKR